MVGSLCRVRRRTPNRSSKRTASPPLNSSVIPTMPHQIIPEVWFAFFPLVFAAFWCCICFLLAAVGGWRQLSVAYGTDRPPHGKEFRWQSGAFGQVNYGACLNLHVASEGMYLSVSWPFRVGHRALLIPWGAIHDEESTRILWRRLTRFRVGTPSIASLQLPTRVFEAHRAAV